MGANNVGGVGGAGNGSVPDFQQGGMSEQAIDKMSNDQLVNLAQNGSEIDRKNATAELRERLGAGGGEKDEKAGGPEKGGGPDKGGGSGDAGGVDDELMKILEKLLKGEKLTPEEEEKLKGALGEKGPNGAEDPQGADVIGGPEAPGDNKI